MAAFGDTPVNMHVPVNIPLLLNLLVTTFFWFLGIYISFSIFNNKAKKKSFLDLIRPKYKYS